MSSTADFLIQLAVEKGRLQAREVEAARAAAGRALTPGELAATLIASGQISERELAQLAADAARLPFRTGDELRPEAAANGLLPRELAERHLVLPLSLREGVLTVAVADPLDLDMMDLVARESGCRVRAVVATPADVSAGLRRMYGPVAAGAAPAPSAVKTEEDLVAEGAAGESEAPVIQLVERVLRVAAERGASDVHWEPLAQRFRVRFRIDGSLVEMDDAPKRLQAAIVSRLKLMANLSLAEKRAPQDGRAHLSVDGRDIDLRVSSLPTTHGESVVMRLLRREGLQVGLDELGLSPRDDAVFRQVLALPDGMVLVTGPTGSGKTTTLYTCLQHLNRPDRKIITVEDPIEYRLSGINQVPVRPEIGLTFAAALRAMLRQAPNLIMLGEIRDAETAENAVNAATTGHMVFSTLHTNDAAGAVTRLVDLGVKPFLVASALRAVIAQRLVRRLCPACAVEAAPTLQEQAVFETVCPGSTPKRVRRPVGCPQCHGVGYRGRLGVFEVLLLDETIRQHIDEQPSSATLKLHARRAGMRTLREDGLSKVLAGVTTVEEVVAATVGD